MRLDPNKEAFLIFADSYWDIDNGKSAVELGQKMLVQHVERVRNTAYGYAGHLDESIARASDIIDTIDRENLIDTINSLCDLGEGDAVTRALKNVVLGAIQKNTGAKAVQTGGVKIKTGTNPSPVRFNGSAVKRNPSKTASATKSFNDVADAPTKVFNRVVSDNVNINAGAKAIMREAIERKTAAALTLKTHPTKRRTEMNKQDYDNEETWTAMAKKEADERAGLTTAAKTIEIPVVRLASFDDTRDRLPPEFRNPKEIPNVVGMTLTDLPQPNTIKGGAAATYRRANQDKTREGQWPSNPGDIQYPEETASSRYPNSRW